MAEEAGDKQGRRWGLLGLGALAGFEGDYRKAERLLRQGLALVEELREDYLKAGRASRPRAGRRWDADATPMHARCSTSRSR